jgi:rhomboid protease GluP
MCRNCGSIVGAGQQQCAVCGASALSSGGTVVERTRGDSEAIRFARAVLNRPYKFTIILLVANLFIFLLMWQSSGLTSAALWEFPETVLVAYGAKLNSLINEHGQWWRFVTPMFVHVNLPHLLVNMYSLWVVGPYVEKLYGSAKFVVFWVVTGIAGVVASYLTVRPALANGTARFLFKGNDVLSAGASGAIFGLVGVLFIFGIKFRRELPEGFKRAFGTGMLPIIAINLFIGYLGRGFIDNAAHLGGLVSGAALAFFVDYRRPGEKSGITIAWQVLQLAAIGLVVVSFGKTAQHFRDTLPGPLLERIAERERLAQVHPESEKFVAYARAMNDGQEAFNLIMTRRDVSGVEAAIKNLDATPQLDPKADELKWKLKDMLVKAKGIETSSEERFGDADRIRSQRELTDAFVAWSREYRAWLKTTGRSYGLVETTETESPTN